MPVELVLALGGGPVHMRSVCTMRGQWFLQQLGLILLGVVLYFGTRGLASGRPSVALANAHDVVALQDWLGLTEERRLQAVLTGRDWLADVANWVYIWGHWPIIATVMVWLAVRHRRVFLRFRNGMLVSGALGLVVFASYPVAPPRLANLGIVDTVTERSAAYRVLQPPAFTNPFAAMPSLHVGWDLLVGLAVFAAASSTVLRLIALLMPALMAISVVLTGNHYLLDVIAGASLALVGHAVAVYWERRTLGPGD